MSLTSYWGQQRMSLTSYPGLIIIIVFVELFCKFESLNLIETVDVIGIDETMSKSPLSIYVWMR